MATILETAIARFRVPPKAPVWMKERGPYDTIFHRPKDWPIERWTGPSDEEIEILLLLGYAKLEDHPTAPCIVLTPEGIALRDKR